MGTTAARLARAQKVVSDSLVGLDEFDADLASDLDVGWGAGWQDDPVAEAFEPDEPFAGYDGAMLEREDPRRPADEEEDHR